MPTLAELRARKSRPVPHARATVTLVEGQHLLAEEGELLEELSEIHVQRDPESDEATTTRKMGEGLPPRVDEIRERLHEISAELAGHQEVVTLTGMEGGAWQRWKDAHPPREGNEDDEQVGDGHCNTSDLFHALGEFVTAWADEPVVAEDWDSWLGERICYADRVDLVHKIVDMQQVKLPKASSLRSSSSTPTDGTD